MNKAVKELRSTSGHRVACLKLSEAVIELVLTVKEEGMDFRHAMQGAVRENLGLEIGQALADSLCIEFVKCCRGGIDNELVFRFALACYLETREL